LEATSASPHVECGGDTTWHEPIDPCARTSATGLVPGPVWALTAETGRSLTDGFGKSQSGVTLRSAGANP